MKYNMTILAAVAGALILGGGLTARASSQGFETDTSGWFAGNQGGYDYGTIARVNGPLSPAAGSHYAVVNDSTPSGPTAGDSAGPFTRFGAYSSTFGGGWTASIDIYLDPTWAVGSGFDYSTAVSNSSGGFLRDFIFHVAQTSAGAISLGASNNSSDSTVDMSVSGDQVTTAGWYTFTSTFSNMGGNLAGTLSVADLGGPTVFSQTLSNPTDAIAGVGGNRYGWFTLINVDDGLAIDNVELSAVPLPAAAWAGLMLLGGLGAVSALKRARRVA